MSKDAWVTQSVKHPLLAQDRASHQALLSGEPASPSLVPPSCVLSVSNKIFFKGFIYLFMRDTHREAETEAEAGEPNAELDPRTPGS